MTIGSLLRGSFQLLRDHPRMLAIWIGAQAVLSVILYLFLRPLLAPLVAERSAAIARGTVPIPAFPPNMGLIICLYIVMMLWMLMLFTAVVRLARSGRDDRFGWIRLGMDELRLIGLALLLIVAAIAAELVIILAGFIIGLIGGLAGQAAAVVLLVVYGLAVFCGVCWIEVRLMLVAPITVLRGRISIRAGWRATRGHFWTLLGTILLLALAFLLFEVVLLAIVQPGLLRAMFSGMPPQETASVLQAQAESMQRGASATTLLFFPVGIVLGTLVLVYVHAILAIAAVTTMDGPAPADPVERSAEAGPWGG